MPETSIFGAVSFRAAVLLVSLAAACAAPPSALSQTRTIVYVDSSATGAANGSAWADAFPNLQDALTSAGKRNGLSEVWVARGTYVPDIGGNTVDDDPLATFDLPPGTAIFGGFAGLETNRDERDPEANPTVLSGEISESAQSENVITIRGRPDGSGTDYLIDGVRVRRAQNGVRVQDDATAVDIVQSYLEEFSVAGVDVVSGDVNISQSSFTGGEIHVRTMSGRTRVFRSRMSASTGNSLFFSGGATGEVWASRFVDAENSAIYVGTGSAVSVRESLILSNKGAAQGGGIYNDGSVSVVLSTFDDNEASVGGGFYGTFRSASNIVGTTFIRNKADQGGGAYFAGSANTLISSYFVENDAVSGGGFINNGELAATNVVLLRNTATNDGGGIYNDGLLTATNLTSAYNIAGREGGGIFADHAAANQADVRNSIFYFNAAPDRAQIGLDEGFSAVSVAFSNVENGLGSGVTNDGGNIDADPLFVACQSEAFGPYTIDAVCPSPDSPVADAGDNSLIPTDTLDIDGDGDTSEPVPVDAGGPLYAEPVVPIADKLAGLRSLIFPYPTTGQCSDTDIKVAGLLRGWVAPIQFESSQSSAPEPVDVDTTRESEYSWAFEAAYDLKDPGVETLSLRIEYPDGTVDRIDRQVEITEVCVERPRRINARAGVALAKAGAGPMEAIVDMGAREANAAPVAIEPGPDPGDGIRIVSIWPNPAGDRMNILLDGADTARQPIEYAVIDALGRVVAGATLPDGSTGVRAVRVDVSALAAGLYVVVLRNQGASVSKPLVIAR